MVTFPFAYYIGTVGALIAYGFLRDPFWFRAALFANIIGAMAGFAAAIPGVVELAAGVPTRRQQRIPRIQHAVFAGAAVVVFVISAVVLWDRWTSRSELDGALALDGTAPLWISTLGLLLASIAASIGWRLVGPAGASFTEPIHHHVRPSLRSSAH